MDWAIHLEDLQVVLKEFNPVAALNEEVLIRCFQEGLRPSIQAQMDSRHQELDSCNKVLNKAIKIESKAAFQSSTSIWEMDARCWKGRRPDKKERTFKPPKEKPKAKPVNSQPNALSGISPKSSGRNLRKT